MVDRLLVHPSHHHHHHLVAPLQTLANAHHHFNRKKRVKRLSSASQLPLNNTNIAGNNNSAYYPTAFITNPCDQLFGPPQLFSDCNDSTAKPDQSLNMSKTSHNDNSSLLGDQSTLDVGCDSDNHQSSSLNRTHESGISENTALMNNDAHERFDYIPTPKWTKIQNSILEELFKKSRYPKSNELKTLAQRFHVMDSDIEVRLIFIIFYLISNIGIYFYCSFRNGSERDEAEIERSEERTKCSKT